MTLAARRWRPSVAALLYWLTATGDLGGSLGQLGVGVETAPNTVANELGTDGGKKKGRKIAEQETR